jgi:hypothetical protein
VQPDQAPVKGGGQKPKDQREDKKKAEVMLMKLRKKKAMMRFSMISPSAFRPVGFWLRAISKTAYIGIPSGCQSPFQMGAKGNRM